MVFLAFFFWSSADRKEGKEEGDSKGENKGVIRTGN